MQFISDLLTLVIPVRNEEGNLGACLESVREFEHVVILDSHSTDRTGEIAAAFGREVIQFTWDGHFPKKRNWLLANYQFKTPWVMFLDADERVTSAWIAEATRVLDANTRLVKRGKNSTDAFVCYYDNWFMGRMLRYGDVMHKAAILRVGAGGYEKIDEDHWSRLDMEIHETIQVTGKTGVIRAHLEHHDHRGLGSYWRKHEEYAKWESNRYRALHGNYARLTLRQKIKYWFIARWWFASAYFIASYIFMRGFLDGKPGYIFAKGKKRYFTSVRQKITGGDQLVGINQVARSATNRGMGDLRTYGQEVASLAVIILQKDEKLHIGRCLTRLAPLNPRQIFVVDCFSTDGSVEEVTNFKANHPTLFTQTTIELVQHAWPGLYAKQFNWALDTLPIAADWVLRMDADEYLTEETIARLQNELPRMDEKIAGLSLELKRRFMGGEIHHGTNGIRLLRIWRYGRGRLEDRAMDEHALVNGDVIDFNGAFYDDNLNTFAWWQEKHRGYAKREAMDALSLFDSPERLKRPSAMDIKKMRYYRLPPYLRAFVYFCLRYFVKHGFLDGLTGWRWHFWQGFWYRWLVDREIAKLRKIHGAA